MGMMVEPIGGRSSHFPSFSKAPHLKGSLASSLVLGGNVRIQALEDGSHAIKQSIGRELTEPAVAQSHTQDSNADERRSGVVDSGCSKELTNGLEARHTGADSHTMRGEQVKRFGEPGGVLSDCVKVVGRRLGL